MPYISTTDQQSFASLTKEIAAADIKTPGELNFLITKLAIQYIALHGMRYQQLNNVMGAIEGTKLEFYRRVVAPYENQKAYENGDPYDALD